MSAPFPAPTSPLYAIVCDYLRAENNKDYDKVASYLAPDYSLQYHPVSLRQPDQNQRLGKEVAMHNLRAFMDGFMDEIGFDVDHPVNVVEGKDCIVVQLRSDGKMKSGKTINQEYLHIFRFNDEQKIISHDNWMDSALARKMFEGEVWPKAGADGRIENAEEAKKAKAA